MIPSRLTLRNFMSYGDEPTVLPFEQMHVACLCGDNGNGKSALLDAITWALWGKTRASSVGSASDDDLIRAGAEETEVDFEFRLDSNHYRVLKRRKRGRSVTSDWQLDRLDDSGDYVPMSGATQRETGRRIADLLRMEYDTFVNSAYLQQGRSDEFTRQTPVRRKAILSEILGLAQYDQLEVRARDLHRERREQADDVGRQIALLEAETGRKPEHERLRQEALAASAAAQERARVQSAELLALRDQLNRLDLLAETLRESTVACERMQADIVQHEADVKARKERIRQLNAIIDQRLSIAADFAALAAARRRREQLEPEIEALNKATGDLAAVISAIELELERKKNALTALEAEARVVEGRAAEHAQALTRIAAIEAEIATAGAVEEQVKSAEASAAELREKFTALRGRNESLRESIVEVDEILELLARPSALCPVCESDLSGDRLRAVTDKQNARRARLAEEQRMLLAEGRVRKAEAEQAEEALRRLAAERDALTASRSRLEELVRQAAALRAAGIDSRSALVAVAEARRVLVEGDFAHPRRIQRMRLEADIARMEVRRPEHESVRATIGRLEGAEKRQVQLEEAQAAIENETGALMRVEAALSERAAELAGLQGSLDALRIQVGEREALRQRAAPIEEALRRTELERDRFAVEAGTLANAIAACERAATELAVRRTDLRAIEQERWIYQNLAVAFGKKGVQALIIENAIPELEAESNGLLNRLTDGAMEIGFATTRAARSGPGEIETLDIQVRDEAGTRPYELFSGGETFRANFAIRIALSRLLANRCGASLQTLIIDEGFGTQDGKGREKLVEAIEAIKGDFEKILVITHVDELKDAFEQRIEVTKDAGGSRIHLL